MTSPLLLGSAGGGSISDAAYDATAWNGVGNVAPSQNAVRDKIEALGAAGTTITDRGDWAASTSYAVGDLYRYAGYRFLTIVAFTSGSLFAFDGTKSVALEQVNYDHPAAFSGDLGWDLECARDNVTTVPTGWTSQNFGGVAAIIERYGAMGITAPIAADQWRYIKKPLTSAPATWELTARVHLPGISTASAFGGLILRDSASGKFYSIAIRSQDQVSVFRWTSDSAFGALVAATDYTVQGCAADCLLKVRKNSNSSFDFLFGSKGGDFTPVALAADPTAGSFMATPDQIGVGWSNNGASIAGQSATFDVDWLRLR